MNKLMWEDVVSLAVRQEGRLAVYVNCGLDYSPETVTVDEAIYEFISTEFVKLYPEQYYSMHDCLYFFDTEDEQMKFYNIFTQPLTDSSAVYAATYDESGNCQTENT
jgi:hypothetical protein